MNATFKPRRAAPQAKIADEDPMVSVAFSTSFSTCPKTGSTLPVKMRSGLISPATRISNISVGFVPIKVRIVCCGRWNLRIEGLTQILAVVQRERSKGAARGGDLLQAAEVADGEGFHGLDSVNEDR